MFSFLLDDPTNKVCRSCDPDKLASYQVDESEDPVYRSYVPDDKVKWTEPYPDYCPIEYTHPSVRKQPAWADPMNTVIIGNWNKLNYVINRKSYIGEYQIENGIPLNIVGRTGIIGRGLLGKWGPNHAADPIVTRWKLDEDNKKVKHPKTKKKILQFVCIRRIDTGEWAIPGGMCDAGEKASLTMYREFMEEALNDETKSQNEKENIRRRLKRLFANGEEIFHGYVDDPRNTDNAWIETVVYNFHDEDRMGFKGIKLQAGDDASHAQWTDVSSELELYANHKEFLHQVVLRLDAHWQQ